jgi:hypothetical protein
MICRTDRRAVPLVIGAAALLWAIPAYAYLDPATGSIILQGLLAGIAGLMVVLRLYWSRVKAFFRRLGGAKSSLEKTNVADPAISEEPK